MFGGLGWAFYGIQADNYNRLEQRHEFMQKDYYKAAQRVRDLKLELHDVTVERDLLKRILSEQNR